MKLAGALHFSLLALVFVVFFIPTYPLLLIFLAHPVGYKAAHIYRKIWGRIILYISGIIPRVTFEQKLKPGKAYIYAPNHSSYLDIISMTYSMPGHFIFMAKNELSKIPLFGIWFKTIDIGVNRSSRMDSFKAFKKAHERLAGGISVCVFPEGTIPAHAPKLGRFKDGAFRLAIENGVEIVPVTMPDNFRRMPDNRSFFSTPGKMRVHVHRPIPTSHLKPEDAGKLSAEVYRIIEEQLKHFNVLKSE